MDNINEERIEKFIREIYGLQIFSVSKLASGVQNSNYLLNTSKGDCVFRIYNFKSMPDIKYVVNTLLLLNQQDFPSPPLVETNGGKWAELIEGKPSLLYFYIPGENPVKISPQIMQQIGMMQGKMHLLLLNQNFKSDVLNWDHKDLMKLTNRQKKLLKTFFKGNEEELSFIVSELARFKFPDELPKGGTHQDIKPENIIIYNKVVEGIVDFDNGYYGDLLHDITTTVMWCCFISNRFDQLLFKKFISAYQSVRRLSELEIAYFCESIKFRMLRESLIWPMYVSHMESEAREKSKYFLNLHRNFNFSEEKLKSVLSK